MTTLGVSFALYTLLIVGVGVYSSRFGKADDEDYFLAGRGLGPWMAALSASASGSSGWVTMGLVGLAFSSGVRAYWLIPGVVFGVAFNWFFLAGRLRDRAATLDALTIPDLLAFHFRERLPILRILSVIVILAAMFLYVAAQMAAAGKAFEASFATIDYRIGVALGVVIILAYTVIGGFRAACWTDYAQALVMIAVLVGMPVYLLATQGGWSFVTTNLEAVDPAMTRWTDGSAGLALIGFLFSSAALGINFGYPGQPHVLVRYMALRDRKDAIVGGTVAVLWVTLVYWGAVTIGLIARAMTQAGAEWGQSMLDDPVAGGELALVVSAMNLLPGVITGLVLAAILAAIASTADSQLVVAASAAASDVYARMVERTRAKAHLLINRIVVLALGVGAGLLVIDKDVSVYNYVVTYGWAMLGAAFGPQIILLVLWKRASYAGCIAGMVTGFALAILWPEIYNPEATGVVLYNLTVAFIAALIVNAIVSLAVPTRPEPAAPERA
jgi:sodium/proline symporter